MTYQTNQFVIYDFPKILFFRTKRRNLCHVCCYIQLQHSTSHFQLIEECISVLLIKKNDSAIIKIEKEILSSHSSFHWWMDELVIPALLIMLDTRVITICCIDMWSFDFSQLTKGISYELLRLFNIRVCSRHFLVPGLFCKISRFLTSHSHYEFRHRHLKFTSNLSVLIK